MLILQHNLQKLDWIHGYVLGKFTLINLSENFSMAMKGRYTN